MFDAHVTTLCCEIVHSSTTSVMLSFNVNTIFCSVMLIIALMHPITFILLYWHSIRLIEWTMKDSAISFCNDNLQ